jgi:hypothetical protein
LELASVTAVTCETFGMMRRESVKICMTFSRLFFLKKNDVLGPSRDLITAFSFQGMVWSIKLILQFLDGAPNSSLISFMSVGGS